MNLVRMPIALLTLRFASAQQPSGQAQPERAEFMRQTLQPLTPEEKSHLQANRHVNRAEWIKGRRIQLVRGKEDRADLGWDKPHAPHWAVVDERLKAAGVAPNQVQAAWVRQANPGPAGPFPVEVKELQRDPVETLHVMHERFRNLRIEYLLSNTRTTERGGSAFLASIEGAATSCALSSGTYAGYATRPLNPEPHAYESGFAVKWLIGDQIAGKAERNYDPAKGPVAAPRCEWGPYVWAHGIKANRDGLSDMRADYSEQDGTHPSPSGRLKVATGLLHFLKTDPTSRVWLMAENAQ